MTDTMLPEPTTRSAGAPARQGSVFVALLRSPVGLVGLLMLATCLLATVLGPMLYPVDPMEIAGRPLLPPGAPDAPPLGTDEVGRDLLAGLLNGGRVTLLVGVAAAALSTFIGVVIGGLAGYLGGWIDSALMRFTEFFQVLPILLFAMVLVTLFQPSVGMLSFAIGIVAWPGTARITRAEFMRIRTLDYVRAARAIGIPSLRIMVRLVLPNALPPIIVISTLIVGSAMLFESGLSFLGLGAPGTVSWGTMLGDNRDKLAIAWWTVTLPGAAIFLAVLSISLIGDGLNDALNPKRRKR
ncbi:ABC transporter permease [Dactylosporangium sp. NPDC050688]|uniref:ABC transporter permease n=1 Tax=Dactylosporangium sp. NPDC050688 TaxID=3157217 RepID=UPI003401A105